MPRFDRSPPASDTYSALSQEQAFVRETDVTQEIDQGLEQELDTTLQTILDNDLRERQSIELALSMQETYSKVRTVLAMTAIGITLAAPVHAYQSDVAENKARAAESTPTIDAIPQSALAKLSEESSALLDPETKAEMERISPISSIFYLAGFDTPDGSVYGKKLSAALHQIVPGEDESINYGEAPLDVVEIGKKIIEHAKEQGKTRISLAGNSLGGIITLQTALYVMENSDIEIDAIINNATPDGSEGLRPETRRDLGMMMDILGNIPDSKYSKAARTAATMAQESERFTDGDMWENISDFWTVYNETQEQIQENRRPGMWLLVDQALAVTNADLEDIIKRIGALRGKKQIPILINMRSAHASDDTVVDVQKSTTNTCDYAQEAGMQCEIAFVEGQRHTSYDFNTDAFAEALAVNGLAERARDGIARERTYFSVMRLSEYNLGNILADQ